MYFVMYDKNLNALGKRKTYPASSWNITKKIFDFDSCTIEGFPIEFDVNDAMFVSLNEDSGKIKYSAIVGISSVKNNVTTITCSDLKTILNNEIIIDFNRTFTSVKSVYEYLLNELISQNKNFFGFSEFTIIANDIESVSFNSNSIVKEKAIGNVWKTLLNLNQFYNIYFTMEIDFINKAYKVILKRMNVDNLTINKNDFNLDLSKKVNTGTNRAVCLNSTGTAKTVYYLLRDNSVVLENEILDNSLIIYPAKIKLFQEDDYEKAKANGKQELLKSRFDEKVEINLNLKMGYLLENKDFNTTVDIKGYKVLPIGQIKEDSKGNRSVILGIEKEEF